MTCDKCQGLVVDEHDEPRCINCGRRPGTPLRIPKLNDEEEANRTRSMPMGKWSPEAREAHKARMQAIWAKKRGEKPRGGGSTSTAVARVEPKILVARPARVAVNGSAVEALEQAIAELDHDRATLERAKEILETRA